MPDPRSNEDDLLKAALGRTGDCPALESLEAAETNPDVQRHLAGCSRCRTELAMLREFRGAEPRAEEMASVEWIASELRRRSPELAGPAPVVHPQPASPRDRLRAWTGGLFAPQRRRTLSLAAVALLVVVAAGVYLRPGANFERPSPSGGTAVWRSGEFAAVSPLGDVTEAPSEFRWQTVPGAATYSIQLVEVDRTVVWSADSTRTSIEVPAEIRQKLKPARAFHWQVVARNAGGQNIASTDLQTFHILATRP